VSLELDGRTANRAAIGARVTVRLQTPSGPRRVHRVVGTGGSFGSSTLRVFVGLGNATAITAVDVAWPVAPAGNSPASAQTFRGFVPGRHYLLKQGAPTPVVLDRTAETLRRSAAPHVH
jgi:hypothetical protein